MTANDFRRLALSFPETAERSHQAHPDFRVAGKIFATLGYPDKDWGMVKLTPEQQQEFVHDEPAMFVPVKGGWGRKGATCVRLKAAKKKALRLALAAAWHNVAPKGLAEQSKEESHSASKTKKKKRTLPEIFDSFERVRMKLPKKSTVKELIEEGRRF